MNKCQTREDAIKVFKGRSRKEDNEIIKTRYTIDIK